MSSQPLRTPSESRLPLVVCKFGGTSVANADRIRTVVDLITETARDARCVAVVSALGGVTDLLLDAVGEALDRTGRHKAIVRELRERHTGVLGELCSPAELAGVETRLDGLWNDLGELLDGVYLLRECTGRTRDAISGVGELASAPIVAAALRDAGVTARDHDARDLALDPVDLYRLTEPGMRRRGLGLGCRTLRDY